MNHALLLFFEGARAGAEGLAAAFKEALTNVLGRQPGQPTIRIFEPVGYTDPYLADETGIDLLVRLEFAAREQLDAALAGSLAAIDPVGLAQSRGYKGRISHAIMRGARYPVAGDPAAAAPPAEVSYQVLYSRSAPDVAGFVRHYEEHHPPILARLPEIRSLALFTSPDATSPLPIPIAELMLVCDVSFDSQEALDAALASDVRRELRRDYDRFPRFDGPVTHQAMRLHRAAKNSGAA